MKHCQKCGSQIQEGTVICSECGTPLNEATSAKQSNNGVHNSVPVAPRNHLMTKKTKILLFSCLFTIILLIGLHLFLQNLYSPNVLIKNFEQALIDGDVKFVANLLTPDNDKLKINEEAVRGFVKYFKENPDNIRSTVSSLEEQLKILEHQNPKQEKDTTHTGMVYLDKDGKFLLYERYKLVVNSVYIEMSTNYQDTILTVDDKEVGKADSDKFSKKYGPFVPGIHTVKASLKTDYVDLSTEKEILLDGDSKNVPVHLYLDGDSVTFDLGDYDGHAKLFINGTDIGQDLVEDSTFGPILIDGSMSFSVEAELPWGTVKTDELPIDSEYIKVNFINESLRKKLMETIHTFNSERFLVRTSADGSKLTTATEEVKNELLALAEYDQERNYVLRVKHVSTTFDLDSFDLEYVPLEDRWYAYVTAKPIWESEYYKKNYGSVGLKENAEVYHYALIYHAVRGKWLIDTESYSESFNNENTKELTVEEPVQYISGWAK